MSKENGGPAVAWEYYYRNKDCYADTAKDDTCICWHAEGTGPHHYAKHDEEMPALEWRIAERSKP